MFRQEYGSQTARSSRFTFSGLPGSPLSPTRLKFGVAGLSATPSLRRCCQQRAWKALQTILAGSTTTYAELAQHIGHPTDVRAVAGACASNPVAVAIPCHRVVSSNGDLRGYGWGIERKRALLDRKAAALAGHLTGSRSGTPYLLMRYRGGISSRHQACHVVAIPPGRYTTEMPRFSLVHSAASVLIVGCFCVLQRREYAPADLPKEAASFDLPIALGIRRTLLREAINYRLLNRHLWT